MRLSGDRESDLTEIVGVTDPVVMRTVGFEVMVDATSEDHLGSFCTMDQDDAAVPRIARALLQDLP